MSGTLTIHELLRSARVQQEATTDSFTRSHFGDLAKVVVCVIDGTPAPALLPVELAVNLERLLSLTGGSEIRLAREEEGLSSGPAEPIYVDVRLASSREVVIRTDTAAETVVIRWAEFARSARPIVGNFAEPPRDRVGAYRLSYRE